MNEFERRNIEMSEQMAADPQARDLSRQWFDHMCRFEYSYHFRWLGRPIIQFPQDMVALQEIIWETKPDLIIETGVAHGGSLIFHASLLELIGGPGKVVGIDIDIRAHNRVEIEKHPMFKRIQLIQGSSVDPGVVDQVKALAAGSQRIMVILDSNHSHAHVLGEMQCYAPLVTPGNYLAVLDTVVEDMDPSLMGTRPWGRGNSPKTAVHEYLKTTDRFEIDRHIDNKLMVSVAPDGYLRCVK
jgi:cephalosporin hydroxylase